jgi:predicted CXXCH cytochrome family protein
MEREVNKVKKSILTVGTVLIAATLVNFHVAMAVDDVAVTKHNLRNVQQLDGIYSSVVDYGEICVYCHTPHNKNTEAVDAPLWNRSVSAEGSYTLYSSPTLDSTIGQPTGVSLACLSCHDGTIGIDVIVNQPATQGDTGGFNPSATMIRDTGDANYNPRIGQDLSDDHPISMQYAGPGGSNVDTQFRDLGAVKADGLRFFGGANQADSDVVQCATCHNPHEATNGKFLRIANDSSNLCMTCHIK